MCATDVRGARRRERGSATVAALILAIVVASLCALMVTSARVSHQKARTRLETDKAFYVAEGGLDFALSQIKEDRAWAVDSTSRFPTLEDDGTLESGWIPMGDGAGEFRMEVAYQVRNALPVDWDEPGLPAGYEPYSNVVIADRADGMPLHDALHIRVVGRYGE